MSRYIDADALIEELQHCSYETWSKDINRAWWAQAVKVKDNIVKCIERQPTADVVEVVRCKDCKHRYVPIRCALWYGSLDDKEYFIESGENFYCPWGERSENDNH